MSVEKRKKGGKKQENTVVIKNVCFLTVFETILRHIKNKQVLDSFELTFCYDFIRLISLNVNPLKMGLKQNPCDTHLCFTSFMKCTILVELGL